MGQCGFLTVWLVPFLTHRQLTFVNPFTLLLLSIFFLIRVSRSDSFQNMSYVQFIKLIFLCKKKNKKIKFYLSSLLYQSFPSFFLKLEIKLKITSKSSDINNSSKVLLGKNPSLTASFEN